MYPLSCTSLLIQDEEDISTELITYVDEHMNMILVEMACCMPSNAGMDKEYFWAEVDFHCL